MDTITKPITTRPGWRKSSHSGGGNDCVEVAEGLNGICDTKDPQHRAIMLPKASVLALFAKIREAA